MALDIEYYERELEFYRNEAANLRKQLDESHERELASLREKLDGQKGLVAIGEKVKPQATAGGAGGGNSGALDLFKFMSTFLGTIGGFALLVVLVIRYMFFSD